MVSSFSCLALRTRVDRHILHSSTVFVKLRGYSWLNESLRRSDIGCERDAQWCFPQYTQNWETTGVFIFPTGQNSP